MDHVVSSQRTTIDLHAQLREVSLGERRADDA